MKYDLLVRDWELNGYRWNAIPNYYHRYYWSWEPVKIAKYFALLTPVNDREEWDILFYDQTGEIVYAVDDVLTFTHYLPLPDDYDYDLIHSMLLRIVSMVAGDILNVNEIVYDYTRYYEFYEDNPVTFLDEWLKIVKFGFDPTKTIRYCPSFRSLYDPHSRFN